MSTLLLFVKKLIQVPVPLQKKKNNNNGIHFSIRFPGNEINSRNRTTLPTTANYTYMPIFVYQQPRPHKSQYATLFELI